MMNTCAVLLAFLLAMVFSITFMEASNGGSFRIELVHRDSPISPFYNSSETNFDRSRKSALRSMSRVKRLSLSATDDFDTIVSQVIPSDQLDYLMKISIGTPPIEVLATVDTGSDLIWTQCQPCLNCYKQDIPIFNPKMSSTYRETSCTSSPCQSLVSSDLAQCVSSICEYTYEYGDKSQTNGTLATETFNFDSTDENQRNVSIPTLVFGCGHSNAGIFSIHGSGLVGLGGGPLSLVSQLGSKIDWKFSYCLVEPSENSTSKLNFGTQAILSGDNVVSTPLVSKTDDVVTFYFLTLEAISVDGQRLESSKPAEGNIIIDSGTSLTTLPTALYNQFESALRMAIPDVPITDPSGSFKLCYSTKSTFDQLPEIIFNFMGADVTLTALNTFLKVSEDLVCLSMAPTDDLAIYGNLAQVNFLIEYDLVGREVSFAATDCTEH